MPLRDQTGKRLSGAAQRSQRAARNRTESAAQERRQAAPPTAALRYEDIPPPNMADPASLITFGARAVAVSMHQAMLDPTITEEQRRREIRDGAAKLGMIRDKAAEQSKLERLAAMVEPRSGGPKGQALAGIEKPATARRAKTN